MHTKILNIFILLLIIIHSTFLSNISNAISEDEIFVYKLIENEIVNKNEEIKYKGRPCIDKGPEFIDNLLYEYSTEKFQGQYLKYEKFKLPLYKESSKFSTQEKAIEARKNVELAADYVTVEGIIYNARKIKEIKGNAENIDTSSSNTIQAAKNDAKTADSAKILNELISSEKDVRDKEEVKLQNEIDIIIKQIADIQKEYNAEYSNYENLKTKRTELDKNWLSYITGERNDHYKKESDSWNKLWGGGESFGGRIDALNLELSTKKDKIERLSKYNILDNLEKKSIKDAKESPYQPIKAQPKPTDPTTTIPSVGTTGLPYTNAEKARQTQPGGSENIDMLEENARKDRILIVQKMQRLETLAREYREQISGAINNECLIRTTGKEMNRVIPFIANFTYVLLIACILFSFFKLALAFGSGENEKVPKTLRGLIVQIILLGVAIALFQPMAVRKSTTTCDVYYGYRINEIWSSRMYTDQIGKIINKEQKVKDCK
jgi:hypothetical protein